MMRLQLTDQALSDLIGSIYDCAIDPARWTFALERMCAVVDAFFGSISIVDSNAMAVRFVSRWGGDPYWIDLLDKQYAGMMPFMPILNRFDVGQPFSMGMAAAHLGDPDVWKGRFATEWANPAGVRDTASVILHRSRSRMVALNLSTGFNREAVTPGDLEVVRLLSPHIRRVLTISDLIETKNLAADTSEVMLDTLHIGVMAVDASFRVRHANLVASEMLGAGSLLATMEGRVVASGSAAGTQALHEAITRAAKDAASPSDNGYGIPLRFADGRPAIAHVLPLHLGEMRSGVGPGAAVAIFIATPTDTHTPADALSSLYELTEAEMRVLGQISEGKNRREAASSLSIADSTVKTHLDHIFSKTGTSTQAELSRLVTSLSAPVASG